MRSTYESTAQLSIHATVSSAGGIQRPDTIAGQLLTLGFDLSSTPKAQTTAAWRPQYKIRGFPAHSAFMYI